MLYQLIMDPSQRTSGALLGKLSFFFFFSFALFLCGLLRGGRGDEDMRCEGDERIG